MSTAEDMAKQEVLALHDANNRERLRRLRLELRRLYFHRLQSNPHAIVTADDARELCQRWWGLDSSFQWLGALFKVPGWRAVRMVKSQSKGRHASRIMGWQYVEP